MTDKFKKLDKGYILSDSSVNEYGFRLLTEGYQLEAFQKNPIGYYMHRREDGVVLKWEDLRVEDDNIVGTPVINLSNERGQQTCEEAENGFLNAASVGHIVVLEYSNEPEMMLPGQTGPTITKWYNKECSLVDIPGNCNALTQLYDAQENEINLVDLSAKTAIIKKITATTKIELCQVLELADSADEISIISATRSLAAKVVGLQVDNGRLHTDNNVLQTQLSELKAAGVQYEISAPLDKALNENKITQELSDKLAVDYTGNPSGLKQLLDAMPAYRSIVEHIKNTNRDRPELQWDWDQFEENDPSGKKLQDLKLNDPEHYRKLFKEKFAA